MEPWQLSSEDYMYQCLDGVRNSKQYAQAPASYKQVMEASAKSKAVSDWYELNEKAYLEGEDVYWVPAWALTPQETADRSDDTLDNFIIRGHRECVMIALSRGFPVPDKVLQIHGLTEGA